MDAFERNKYNPQDFTKMILAESMIVGYGFITSIEFDGVIVTLAVSGSGTAERVKCTFMNLGDELFVINRKPVIGMRVLVLSPNSAAEGMYESFAQINMNQGRDYILTGTPAVYSSQFAFCIPMMKSSSQAFNNLVLNTDALTAELNSAVQAVFNSLIEVDFNGDTIIEMKEGTKHSINCDGNMDKTFGMIEGIEGAEKTGTFIYKETYGRFASVEKNYGRGLNAVIGKAYEKPFATNKGELLDSSAPVTILFGNAAPVSLTHGAPLTLTFGENVMTVTADKETGLSIALTGDTKVSITAESGKIKFNNSSGSLKTVLDNIADLCSSITAVGVGVAPGEPLTLALDPALVTQFSTNLKTLIANIFE